MRVVMHIALVFRKSKTETIRERYAKELETALVPMPGMTVFDPALERDEIPQEVGVNFDEGFYYLQFKDVTATAAGDYSSVVNRFKKNGWHELHGAP